MTYRLIAFLLSLMILCSAAMLTSCNSNAEPADTDHTEDTADTLTVSDESHEITMLPSQEVRVISMNMSYETANMEERRAVMIPLLLSYEPDSIGTQENGGRPGWHHYFKEDMPNYERVGYFSSGELEMEDHYVREPFTGYYIYYSANYIFYNADKYECLDWNTIWLSRDPTLLTSYDGCLLRTCTWAILENKETGFRYAHVNAHLGYENDGVNLYQIGLVRDLILKFYKLGLPVFTTGDFNTPEGSGSYQLMTGVEEISDTKFLAESSKSDGKTPIDFCFVTGQVMTVHEYEVIETTIDGLELTDHDGIFARATVHSLPDTYKDPVIPTNDGIITTEVHRGAHVYDFTFTQADDIELIDEYYVELIDVKGNKVDERRIYSCHMDFEVPETLSCTFASLEPNTDYTLNIYAVNMIGTMSEPVTVTFTTKPLEQTQNNK